MKHYLTAAFLFFLSACKTQDPGPSTGGGPTDVGNPQGEVVSQVVGASGGTLVSSDGSVRLEIPAGALSSDTRISIQPISNEAPNGVGLAYRFLPDGTQFHKPARLTMSFRGASSAAYDPIRIAFQDKDAFWYPAEEVSANSDTREVTVSMPHFSDWSVVEMQQLENIHLQGDKGFLDLGESAELQVLELEPLTPGKPLKRRPATVRMWEVTGSGNGTIQANGNSAVYTAPTTLPQQNPVVITVEVKLGSSVAHLVLSKEIFVGASSGTFFIDGQRYTCTKVNLVEDDNWLSIDGGFPGGGIVLEIQDKRTGTFAFGQNWVPGSGAGGVNLSLPDGRHFEHYKYCGDDLLMTKGKITIERYKPGNYAIGSFSGNVIHLHQDNCSIGPLISGTFFAKVP